MEFNPYPDPFVYTPQSGQKSADAAGGKAPSPETASAWRQIPSPPEQAFAPKIAESRTPEPVKVSSANPLAEQSPPPAMQEKLDPAPTDFADEAAYEPAKRNLGGVIGFFVIVGLIIGSWYFFSNSGTPLSPPAGEKTPDLQPNLIAASLGGTIRNGEASVIIPPDALTSDTEIFINRVAEGEITDLYYLEPHGYKFLKPVTVIIPYKKNPSRLKYTQNGTEKYLSFTIDKVAKTLRIEVMEF